MVNLVYTLLVHYVYRKPKISFNHSRYAKRLSWSNYTANGTFKNIVCPMNGMVPVYCVHHQFIPIKNNIPHQYELTFIFSHFSKSNYIDSSLHVFFIFSEVNNCPRTGQ